MKPYISTTFILIFIINIYSQEERLTEDYINKNLIARGIVNYTFLTKKNNTNYFHLRRKFGDGASPVILAIHDVESDESILNLVADVEYTKVRSKSHPYLIGDIEYKKIENVEEESEFFLDLLFNSEFSILEHDYLNMPGKNIIPILHYVEDVVFEWQPDYGVHEKPIVIARLRKDFNKEIDDFKWYLNYSVNLSNVGTKSANSVDEFISKGEKIGSRLSTRQEVKDSLLLAASIRKEKLLKKGFVFKKPDSWKEYETQKTFLQNIYNGNFDKVKNDIFFRHLYCTYVYEMAGSCSSLLPSNKKEITLEKTSHKSGYSGFLLTGVKSMPFINTYEDKVTTTETTLYIDPKFERFFLLYVSTRTREVSMNFIASFFDDKGANMDVFYELAELNAFIKNEYCERKSFIQLGENILRFAKGQKSIQDAGLLKK